MSNSTENDDPNDNQAYPPEGMTVMSSGDRGDGEGPRVWWCETPSTGFRKTAVADANKIAGLIHLKGRMAGMRDAAADVRIHGFGTEASAHSSEDVERVAKRMDDIADAFGTIVERCGHRKHRTPLTMWVIYENPSDYPGKFVVRKMFCGTPAVFAVRPTAVVDTLAEAQDSVPDHCSVIPRSPSDDPVILETWV